MVISRVEPVFIKRLGPFRKIFGKSVDFVYVTAPHLINPSTELRLLQQEKQRQLAEAQGVELEIETPQTDEEVFKWWDAGGQDWQTTSHYNGAAESIEFIKKTFQDNDGYFDGVVGFSQGGVLASILCTLRNPDSDTLIKQHKENGHNLTTLSNPLCFRFAIISSAFAPSAIPYKDYFSDIEKKNSIPPTLHIYGLKDDLVVSDRSRKLVSLFPNPLVLEHEGGHYLPVSGAAKNTFRSFVKSYAEPEQKKQQPKPKTTKPKKNSKEEEDNNSINNNNNGVTQVTSEKE